MARARIRAKAPKPPTQTLEQRLLIQQLTEKGYAALPEVRFHPARKWRIDVAVVPMYDTSIPLTREWLDAACYVRRAFAVEIDGGAWSRGRHVRGSGFIADMEKQNALTELGWRVLRFTPQQVRDGTALAQIERCL